MDELDLLLEDLITDDAPAAVEAPEDYAELALQEFTTAGNSADRLEALKLLMRLVNK